jgi:hypothetical protein
LEITGDRAGWTGISDIGDRWLKDHIQGQAPGVPRD